MNDRKILKIGEIDIINRLNDEVYNVEFFEKFIGSPDTAENETQKIEASGFLRAIQKAAEADLHIFPRAYFRMFSGISDAVDKIDAISDLLKIIMGNAEELFISGDETG